MLNKIFKKHIEDYKANDLMVKHVITLSSVENLWKAQSVMSRYRIKKIVVTQIKKHPIGILTLKDIIKFLIDDKIDRDLDEIRISEAMTRNLITANKNSTITECAKTLTKNNISSLIIVEDDNNNVAGIITTTDFTNFFSENCIGFAFVKDYMSQSFFTISIKEKVSTAARIMSEKKVSRLIVVDPDNQDKLAGIISETDISRTVPAFKSKTIRSVYENMELLFSSKSKPDFIEPSFVRIEDIMTRNIITISKDVDLAEAAKIMIKQGISGLPVIEARDNMEQPIGVISKSDIVKALITEEGLIE
jgi:CBS domain-containing protein